MHRTCTRVRRWHYLAILKDAKGVLLDLTRGADTQDALPAVAVERFSVGAADSNTRYGISMNADRNGQLSPPRSLDHRMMGEPWVLVS